MLMCFLLGLMLICISADGNNFVEELLTYVQKCLVCHLSHTDGACLGSSSG